jgi:putative transcriptional regulator
MTDEELEAFEDGRDFHADLLQSIHEMKTGRGTVIHSQAIAARTASGLSQAQFAALLGVSVRVRCKSGSRDDASLPARRRHCCVWQ